MRARVIASTGTSRNTVEEDMIFAGHMAGICYMPDDYDTLFFEPKEKTLKRVGGCALNGHHSVFQHTHITLLLEGIPKILAMVLNNEKVYNTSEKSGRYTFMKSAEQFNPQSTEGRERELYDKWYDIFNHQISELYPDMTPVNVRHLAQENARFLVSAFTPATTMAYTASLCQINYCLDWMVKFIQQGFMYRPKGCPLTFGERLASVYQEFLTQVSPQVEVHGLNDTKDRELSLFARDYRNEEWGENYCINYQGTFVHVAQALRHRTLDYEIMIPVSDPQFYVPEFIRDTPLAAEWLTDISSLAADYPIGMLIHINERGTIENFMLKLQERFCGHAQVEICKTTQANLRRYYDALAPDIAVLTNPASIDPAALARHERYAQLRRKLEQYLDRPVCQFEGLNHICNSPCYCGPDHIFDRKV